MAGVLFQINPPAPNARVLVCTSPDNGYPGTPASIFSDSALTIPVNQPVSLGASGFFSFYIAAGTYTIQLFGPGYNSGNREVVTIGGGGGGGGTVTNTGDLTAGHLVTGNGGVDVSANATWTLPGGGTQFVGTDDAAGFNINNADSSRQWYALPNETAIVDNSTNAYISESATDGLALSGVPIDLSDNSGGSFPDIIDSTGAHGTAGQVLSSLGAGLGVKWVDP